MQVSEEFQVAVNACEAAMKLQLRGFGAPGSGVRAKTPTELVTDMDLECEKAVVDLIRRRFPDHNFQGEEQGDYGVDSEHTWYIDPLDGTHNFVFGIPLFGVSVALTRNREPVCGVVGNTMADEVIGAGKGRGAWRNGVRVRVSGRDRLDESLVIFDSKFPVIGGGMYRDFQRVADDCFAVRCTGCAVFNLSSVAVGRADAFVEHGCKPEDAAAGVLLVRESGGAVTDFAGRDWELGSGAFVASNGLIHAAVLDRLAQRRDLPDAGA